MMGFAKPRVVAADEEAEVAAAPRPEALRFIEALLFAAAEPLDEETLAAPIRRSIAARASASDHTVRRAKRTRASACFCRCAA